MPLTRLPHLAQELGADERTLRRAVSEGTVHAHRPGPRRVNVSEDELQYLNSHWGLLSQLRRAMRTEPRVRLATLYGSTARGDDGPDSDLDLLVAFDHDDPLAAAGLAQRLGRRLGHEVDVALLPHVEQRSPLLLLAALDEGRVLVDRDGRWPKLQRRRRTVARRADEDFDERMAATAVAVRKLIRD